MSQVIAYCILDPSSKTLLAESANLRKLLSVNSPEGLLHLMESAPGKSFLDGLLEGEGKTAFPLQKNGRTFLVEATPLQNRAKAAEESHWTLLSFRAAASGSSLREERTDPVTGLPDRTALDTQVANWARLNSGRPHSFALLFLDLDGFKQVNDRWGHLLGDRFLAEVARRWKNSLRHNDLLVRYGGDEFVILLPGITQAEEVDLVITRLKQSLHTPLEVEGKAVALGVSIGMALASPENADLTKLVAEADREMYESKKEGRGSTRR